MALKFLNKKGWHTGSLKNLENVWKAEQKHEAEQKKLEELKLQLHKEREAEELRQLHVAAGIAPRQDRLEFLYDSGVGVGAGASSSKPSTAEEYNPGTALESAKKDTKSGQQPGEKFAPAIPGALFSESNPQSANDKWRKIHSDPLYLIKQQELAALERIRKNPVKMQMLESQIRKKLEPEKREYKAEDGDSRPHKKKKHDRDKGRHHKLEPEKSEDKAEDGDSRPHKKKKHDRDRDRHHKKNKHGRDGRHHEKKIPEENDPGGKRRHRHDR